MMTTIETYVRKGQVSLQKWTADPAVRLGAKIGGCFAGGMILSAASLAQHALPLTMGLVCALQGWMAAVTAAC